MEEFLNSPNNISVYSCLQRIRLGNGRLEKIKSCFTCLKRTYKTVGFIVCFFSLLKNNVFVGIYGSGVTAELAGSHSLPTGREPYGLSHILVSDGGESESEDK